MGARGPAPTPSNLKVLRGTFRKDRAADNEPKPEVKAPSCPTWLHREAKREWRRIVKHLVKLGLVTELDRAALAAYCQAYADWWKMEKRVEEVGEVQVTKSGYAAQRPEVSMRDKAWERMLKAAKEFGFTPSSRSRVSAADTGTQTDDFFGF